jgi:hypothetical protein
MDPIHPILPTAPHIPSVAPPSGVTPTQRQIERQRHEAERERRRQKQQQQSRASYEDPDEYASDDDAGEDDGRLHFDVIVWPQSVQPPLDTPKVGTRDVDNSGCDRPQGAAGGLTTQHTTEVYSLCPCLF